MKDIPKRLTCGEVAVLAMLGWLLFLGGAANGLTLLEMLVALGFAAAVLVMVKLWVVTCDDLGKDDESSDCKK